MNIIINGKFITQRVTGVQRYAREIINELDKIVKDGVIEIVVPQCDIQNLPKLKNIKIKQIGKLKGNMWEQISLPLYAIKNNKLILNLCNSSPILKPDIVCIHDIKIKARPQDFSKKFLYWYKIMFFNTFKRSKAILTVSEFSKSEINKYYGVSPDRIHVIYNGWQHYNSIGFDENTLSKYGLIKGQYYFAMSSLEPNKNFRWIVETAKNNPNEVFAIAGSVNKDVFNNNFENADIDNVSFLGYVSDEEAKTLMRDCKAFLFPSFYEGFGIPPLEALSAGARAIVSDTACMREIFSSSVAYIDPNKPCRNMSLLNLEGVDLPEKVLNRFSWSNSANSLKALLDKYGG